MGSSGFEGDLIVKYDYDSRGLFSHSYNKTFDV